MEAPLRWERLTSSTKRAASTAAGFARRQGRQANALDLLFGVSQEHGEKAPPFELLRFFNIPERALYENLRVSPADQSAEASSASEAKPDEDPLASGQVGEEAARILNAGMELADKFNHADTPPLLRLHDLFGALLQEPSAAQSILQSILGPTQIPYDKITSVYRDFLDAAHQTTLPDFLAKAFPRTTPPAPGADLTAPPGLHITVTENSEGWQLPVEGLAVVPFGVFYRALEKSLPPEAGSQLGEVLKQHLTGGLDHLHPVAVPLDQTLGKMVLPNSPTGKACLIMAVGRNLAVSLSNIRPMMQAVLALADGQGLGSLAMPLLGAPGEPTSQVDAATEMLNELTSGAAYANLKQVYILTLRPEVVEAARHYTPQAPKTSPAPGPATLPVTPLPVLPRSQRIYNDRPEGPDQLGIRDEVSALADTLLLRDVEPPLAVGVLGGWGSGKSFILHLISERMADQRTWKLAKGYADDGLPGAVSDYVGHIYQITFNAWTYAKSNLWASLMQSIFFELNRQLSLEKLFARVRPPLGGTGLYRLLYNENVAADRGLVSLLRDKGTLTEADLQQIQGHDSQVLWDTLRNRQAALIQELTGAEAALAQASEGLNADTRRLEETANNQLAGEDRQAGFYAIMNLTVELVGDMLGREFRQHVMIQQMDRRVVDSVRSIMSGGTTAGEKKAQLKDQGVDEKHANRLVAKWPSAPAEPADAEKVEVAAIREILQSQKLSDEEVKQAMEALPSLRATALHLWQTAWKHRWVSLLLVAVFFLIYFGLPGALAYLFGQAEWSRSLVMRVFSALTGAVPLVWPTVRVALAWNKQVSKALGAYEAAEARGREAWAKRREAWLAERRAVEREAVNRIVQGKGTPQAKLEALARLAADGNLMARETQMGMLQTQVEELHRKIGPTSRYASLFDFVQARLDAQYYESQLGLMHQAKQDLDELTASLTIDRLDDPATIKAKQQLFPRGPARVFLFIDDLDRCPPPRVVEVLEAVQLLLCTRLFVVILGLDTRYVTLALEKEYKDILRHEGDPSGMDYIEKIIQIPYGVRPIDTSGLKTYLEAQMQLERAATAQAATAPQGKPPKPPAAPKPGEVPEGPKPPVEPAGQTAGDGKQPALPAGGGQPATGTPGTPGPEPRPRDPEFDRMMAESVAPAESQLQEQRFTQADSEDLLACDQLVDLTPRAVRRLVNVFKLIKVYWARAAGREPERPVRRTIISLLALAAAYPEILREAYVQIDMHYRNPSAPDYDISPFLVGLSWQKSVEEAFAWQLSRFRADLDRLTQQGLCQATLTELGDANFNLIRSFSFVGDPSYWTNPQTSKPVK